MPEYRDPGARALTMIPAEELNSTLSVLAGFDFTFVPGDPPRSGRFAAFRLDGDDGEATSGDRLAGLGDQGTIEIAVPAGKSIRRRRVPATLLSVATALPLLLDVEDSPATTATARAWASVMTAGIGLIAVAVCIRLSARAAWTPGALAHSIRVTTPSSSSSRGPCRHLGTRFCSYH